MIKRLIFIALLGAFVAAPIMAGPYGTVDVKFEGVSGAPGKWVGIWSSNTNYAGGTSFWTGVYQLSLKNLVNSTAPSEWEPYLDGPVDSFCVDLWDTAPGAYQTYNVMPLDEVPDPQAEPDGEGMGTAKAGAVAALLNTYWTPSLTNLQAAAVQASVWEIIDEQTSATWDVLMGNTATRGNFYVGNNDVANLANSWLLNLGTAPYANSYVGLSNPIDSKDPNYQDYVVRVPVPAAFLLGMLGLSVAGIKLRKFA